MQRKIVALATGTQKSAVAILRMSGSGTKDALKQIFRPFPSMPNYLQYGKINLEQLTDDGMLVYFDAPKSYTGEEMAELHLHGSMPLVKAVMDRLFELGFVMAVNGEFTKRAFINGKTNLSKAEGLADLINAESFAGLRASVILSQGKLAQKTQKIQEMLTDALANLEATLDYPEEDLEETELPKIKEILTTALEQTQQILQTEKLGATAKNGVKVAIVGDTNVGKSSLLNAIVGYDRAIVSSVKGTTRDTIEESIDFKGIKMTFVDTAGQRETQDEIEQIGVKRAKQAMQTADVVLVVLGDDAKLPAEYQNTTSPTIVIKNKGDLNDYKGDAQLLVSAKTGQNLELLLNTIFELVDGQQVMSAPILLTSQRQCQLLTNGKDCLVDAISSITNGETVDIVAMKIKQAWTEFGQIVGNTDMQTVVDRIFEKFCLGK